MSTPNYRRRAFAAVALVAGFLAACSSDPTIGPSDPPLGPEFVVVPPVPDGAEGGSFSAFVANNSLRVTTEFWDNNSADNILPGTTACNIGFFAAGTMAAGCLNEATGSDANMGGFAPPGGTSWGNVSGALIDPASFMFDGDFAYTVTLVGSYAGQTSEVGWFTKVGNAYTFNNVPQFGAKTINHQIVIPAGADWGFYVRNTFNPSVIGCATNTDCSDATGGFAPPPANTLPLQQFALFRSSDQEKFLVGIEDNKLELMPNGSFYDSDYQDYVLTVEAIDPPQPALFLVIDEDGIDNGKRWWYNSATTFTSSNIKQWSTADVNDDKPGLAQRDELRWFDAHEGETFWFFTGQVGDEAWFAPTFIPSSWSNAGPTGDGLTNFLGQVNNGENTVGPGLGTGGNPEALLDKVPHVIPLRAEGLFGLIGRTVCALVWDSDISVNYDHSKPELGINGVLKGEKYGVVAFKVLENGVVYLRGFSSSTLPRVQVTILDAEEVCGGDLALYLSAPKPASSSEPMDVKPNFAGDNGTGSKGYLP